MIAAGAPPLAIILTTYVVNMRHYLMAATLAPSFRGFRRRWLALIAHVIKTSRSPSPWRARGRPTRGSTSAARPPSRAPSSGVAVGTALGGLVERPERYGLDFAFPRCSGARGRAAAPANDWLVAIGAAVLAVALALVLPGNWHIVVAGLTVSALGALLLPLDDTTEPTGTRR